MRKMLTHVRRSRWMPKRSAVYLFVTVAGLAAALAARYAELIESSETLLGVIGAVSAVGFFLIQNALEDARFRRELFVQFNEKYDEHNGKLIALLEAFKAAPADDGPANWRETLEDYFNLCGEEYYYYRKGYVDGEVWANWLRGMYWWYGAHERIENYWDEKLAEDSYYGLTRPILRGGRRDHRHRKAHRHGLAGQYGKAEADKRSKRMLLHLMMAGAVGTAGVGFVYGFFLSRFGPWGGLLGLVVVAVLFPLVWRPVSRHLDKAARQRIKFMRGGQGEALVAWVLEGLDDEWHVFNGIKLEADSDIDHVVAGPGGLFCISTKSHRGLFTGTAEGLLHNNKPSPFAQDALRQTMGLKDRLAALMGKDVPWVQPVLAVPFGFTDGNPCGGKVWLVHADNVNDRIAPEKTPKRLDKLQLGRVVTVLEMLQRGAAEVYQRPDPVARPMG